MREACDLLFSLGNNSRSRVKRFPGDKLAKDSAVGRCYLLSSAILDEVA